MSVRLAILAEFKRVAQEQDKQLAPLVDELALLDSGLDSLSLAIVVSRLEDLLGIDPFSAAVESQFPVTLGDFVALYEKASQ